MYIYKYTYTCMYPSIRAPAAPGVTTTSVMAAAVSTAVVQQQQLLLLQCAGIGLRARELLWEVLGAAAALKRLLYGRLVALQCSAVAAGLFAHAGQCVAAVCACACCSQGAVPRRTALASTAPMLPASDVVPARTAVRAKRPSCFAW